MNNGLLEMIVDGPMSCSYTLCTLEYKVLLTGPF